MISILITSTLLGLTISILYTLIYELCIEFCIPIYQVVAYFIAEIATYNIWNYFIMLIASMIGGCLGVLTVGVILICTLLGWKACLYEMWNLIRQRL